MARISLDVNGKVHTIDADPDMPLLYALRNDIGLNNPHFGCGLAQCGACTVHIDGQAIRSCVTPVANVGVNGLLALLGLLTVGTAVATWLAGQTAGTLILVWYVARRTVGFGNGHAAKGGN
jgi:xanthine dehydrogenase iron-sulfur cluster and FAD-binding subunit A